MNAFNFSSSNQLRGLAELMGIISQYSSYKPLEAFQKIIPSIASLMDADTASYCLYHPEAHSATCIVNSNEAFPLIESTYPLESTPCDQVIQSRNACIFPDNVSELFPDDAWLKDHSIRGYLGAPVIDLEGNPIGIAYCLYKDGIVNTDATKNTFQFLTSLLSEMVQKDLIRQKLSTVESKLSKTRNHSMLCQAEIDPTGKILTQNTAWLETPILTEKKNNQCYLSSKILEDGGIPLYRSTQLRDVFFNLQSPFQGKLYDQDNPKNTFMISAIGHRDYYNHENINSIVEIQDTTSQTAQRSTVALTQEIISSTNEAITITDSRGVITNVNPAFEKITGYKAEEVIGKNPKILQSGKHDELFYKKMWQHIFDKGYWEGDIWNKKKDGTIYLEHIYIKRVLNENGQTTNFIAAFQDETLKEKMRKKILLLTDEDEATGFPNKRKTLEKLDQLIESGKQYAVLLMLHDITEPQLSSQKENYKELLKKIQRLSIKDYHVNAFLGVTGQSEFMLIIPDFHLDNIASLVKKITQVTVQTNNISFRKNGTGVVFSNSIIRNALECMHLAKEAAKIASTHNSDRVKILDTKEIRDLQLSTKLESELHSAIYNEQIYAAYEPLVNLPSNAIHGTEALARWEHPTLGMIPPSVFLPIASHMGIFNELTKKLLNDTCKQMKRWLDEGCSLDTLSVNVSAQQIDLDYLPELIKKTLIESKLDPKYLQIEVTEESLIDKVQSPEVLQKIRDMGVRVAIDDFGSGYSSLSYLKELPVSTLKIDQSFIRESDHNVKDIAIISSIVSLAKNLGLEVIAEGIENERQKELLIDLGCTLGQGYYYSKARRAKQFRTLLRDG